MRAMLVFLWVLVVSGAGVARGVTPRFLSYQGCLVDSTGRPLPDEFHSVTFRIWDAETNGSILWTESLGVDTRNGDYAVILGERTPLNLPFDRLYWLGVQIAQEAENSPRTPLTSVSACAYAEMAGTAESVGGYRLSLPWYESGYSDCLGRRTNFAITGDRGATDLYIPIAHFYAFRIVLDCPHAAPRVGDVAFAECVENDGVISFLGVTGSGRQVRRSSWLTSKDLILSVRGGHVTLSCPGDGSNRLKVHTEGEWVLGYLLY